LIGYHFKVFVSVAWQYSILRTNPSDRSGVSSFVLSEKEKLVAINSENFPANFF
jgi:hypothetical protein